MPNDIMTDSELAEIEARAATALSKLDREGYDTWVEVQQPTYDMPALCVSHRLLQERYDELRRGVMNGSVWGIRQMAKLFSAQGDDWLKERIATGKISSRTIINLVLELPREQ